MRQGELSSVTVSLVTRVTDWEGRDEEHGLWDKADLDVNFGVSVFFLDK